MSLDSLDPRWMRGPFAWAAITTLTGLCAFGLMHCLARAVAPGGARPDRFARTVAEPEVTGSIAPVLAPPAARTPPFAAGARSIVLEPGAGGRRLVVRGP